MGWPWKRTEASKRGTVTLLADGSVIAGFPPDAEVTDAEMVAVRDALKRWHANKGLLVFPWPVDVVDRR